MTTALSAAAWRAQAQPRPSKYHARRTTVDGVAFASKREATEYARLKLLERAGLLRDLVLQPVFVLHAPGGQAVAAYRADFRYATPGPSAADWVSHVVDVKGVRTPVYRLKKRWVEAEYGIRIEEC